MSRWRCWIFRLQAIDRRRQAESARGLRRQARRLSARCPHAGGAGPEPFNFVGWFWIVAPAGTPPEIIAALNAAFVKALRDPAAIEKIRVLGAEPAPTSPEAFAKFIQSESAKWGKLIAEAGIKAE